MNEDPDITFFRKQPCPYCGAKVDAASSPQPGPTRPPRDGDFMLCFTCAEPAVFRATPLGQTLVKPTAEQMAQFAVDYGELAERLREFHDKR